MRHNLMADTVSSTRRSYIMSRIGSKDTKPELVVRRHLFKNGLRYRLHVKAMPGCPDVVLPKYKTVIFINGCFWHGHSKCKKSVPPKTNTEWWIRKIEKNIANDQKALILLEKDGWNIFVVWECDLKNTKANDTLANLVDTIKSLGTGSVK